MRGCNHSTPFAIGVSRHQATPRDFVAVFSVRGRLRTAVQSTETQLGSVFVGGRLACASQTAHCARTPSRAPPGVNDSSAGAGGGGAVGSGIGGAGGWPLSVEGFPLLQARPLAGVGCLKAIRPQRKYKGNRPPPPPQTAFSPFDTQSPAHPPSRAPPRPAAAGLSLLLGAGGGALAKDPYVRGMTGRTQQRVIARFRVTNHGAGAREPGANGRVCTAGRAGLRAGGPAPLDQDQDQDQDQNQILILILGLGEIRGALRQGHP